MLGTLKSAEPPVEEPAQCEPRAEGDMLLAKEIEETKINGNLCELQLSEISALNFHGCFLCLNTAC